MDFGWPNVEIGMASCYFLALIPCMDAMDTMHGTTGPVVIRKLLMSSDIPGHQILSHTEAKT